MCVPADWQLTDLGSIATWFSGGTLSTKNGTTGTAFRGPPMGRRGSMLLSIPDGTLASA